MNYGDVCRTAPATPGLLNNMLYLHQIFLQTQPSDLWSNNLKGIGFKPNLLFGRLLRGTAVWDMMQAASGPLAIKSGVGTPLLDMSSPVKSLIRNLNKKANKKFLFVTHLCFPSKHST